MDKVSDGHEIKIGDVIVQKHCFGNNKWAVHRVTKRYSFVWYNDISEGKFPRKYSFGFSSLPRQKHSMASYEVWTK